MSSHFTWERLPRHRFPFVFGGKRGNLSPINSHLMILETILAPLAPLASLRGLEAGLHAYLELRSDINASLVTRLARERDVIVTTLDAYYLGTPDRSGLLLGYASLAIPDIIQGAKVVKEVIQQVAALQSHS